jgi:non-ribosomal peptide synthetase component F
METIIAAVAGLLTGVLVVSLTARATQKIETRKQAGQLAAEAFVDMLQALSENSEANAVLRGSSADPLLQNPSENERSDFIQRLADSRVKVISAKSRLLTFGSVSVAEAAHAALAGENIVLADPETQRDLCELIQRIREDLYPHQHRLPDRHVIEMLFGKDAKGSC